MDRAASSPAPLTRHASREESTALLRDLTADSEASFHAGQWEAIDALVNEHRRAVVVERTGWGKSAVYFIASMLQRRRGSGPTLIVSPLLALMRDQVDAAARAGVRAASMSSANPEEWNSIEQALADADIDILLISPERLVNPRFQVEQLPSLISRIGLLVIDEAHCISDLGHDFRPDYRRIKNLISDLDPAVPVLATTATANARVTTDIAEQLSEGASTEVYTQRGSLARQTLCLGVLDLPDQATRIGWLLDHLADFKGSGIIYCLTVSTAEKVAQILHKHGHEVAAYTGRTDPQDRQLLEAELKNNQVKALVATSALGMGFDKPDLGFVIHLGAPSSPVSYYQQIGRAGRGVSTADVVLLPGSEDPEIWNYFATATMPTEQRASDVISVLSDGRARSLPCLESQVRIRRSTLETLLKVMSIEGAVQKVSGGWQSTGEGWSYDAPRYGRVMAARKHEQQAMLAYETLTTCRMAFLTEALDDPQSQPCGCCDNCTGSALDTTVSRSAVANATADMNRAGEIIAPRSMWPTGMSALSLNGDDRPLKGRIPEEQLADEGRVLARLRDMGWGIQLRELFAPDAQGRAVDQSVPDPLAKAVVDVLKNWEWKARPAAVVAIGSLTRPELISSLGRGIARIGRLKYCGELRAHTRPVDRHTNSAFRLRDVWNRFEVLPETRQQILDLDHAPILLVDDLIASRWTMTVAAKQLRLAGAGPILPFALALEA